MRYGSTKKNSFWTKRRELAVDFVFSVLKMSSGSSSFGKCKNLVFHLVK